MSRAERIARAVYDVRFLLVVVIITVLAAVLIPIRQNRTTNDRLLQTAKATRATQLDNRDTNNRIKDCVDPNGQCYKNSAKRSADVLARLEKYTEAANVCAVVLTNMNGSTDRAVTRRELRACIAAELKEAE